MVSSVLNFEAVTNAPTSAEPFPHFVAQDVLDAAALAAIDKDFPAITQPGLYPVSGLKFGPSFAEVIANIECAELEGIIEEKYGLKLSDKPLLVTVRGFCRARDGRIHNDSKDKIVSCLLYLNSAAWTEGGGKLRLLRDGHDLENLVVEIPPKGGTLVSFRRTDNSWHGHARYEGPRRYLMFNWLASETALLRNLGRHKISSAFKRFEAFADDM